MTELKNPNGDRLTEKRIQDIIRAEIYLHEDDGLCGDALAAENIWKEVQSDAARVREETAREIFLEVDKLAWSSTRRLTNMMDYGILKDKYLGDWRKVMYPKVSPDTSKNGK